MRQSTRILCATFNDDCAYMDNNVTGYTVMFCKYVTEKIIIMKFNVRSGSKIRLSTFGIFD